MSLQWISLNLWLAQHFACNFVSKDWSYEDVTRQRLAMESQSCDYSFQIQMCSLCSKQDAAHEPEFPNPGRTVLVWQACCGTFVRNSRKTDTWGNALVRHSCRTLLRDSCIKLLWDSLAERCCVILLRDTLVWPSCGTLLHSCGTLLWYTVGPSDMWGTFVWDSCGALGTPSWEARLLYDTLVAHSCGDDAPPPENTSTETSAKHHPQKTQPPKY